MQRWIVVAQREEGLRDNKNTLLLSLFDRRRLLLVQPRASHVPVKIAWTQHTKHPYLLLFIFPSSYFSATRFYLFLLVVLPFLILLGQRAHTHPAFATHFWHCVSQTHTCEIRPQPMQRRRTTIDFILLSYPTQYNGFLLLLSIIICYSLALCGLFRRRAGGGVARHRDRSVPLDKGSYFGVSFSRALYN